MLRGGQETIGGQKEVREVEERETEERMTDNTRAFRVERTKKEELKQLREEEGR